MPHTRHEYDVPTGPEAEPEPGSRGRVLRNLLGIKLKSEMDAVEFEGLKAAQELYTHRLGPDTRVTCDLLCSMHRDWLGGIYEWAGRYRSVELSKGGFSWPPARMVPDNMRLFEANVLGRATPCTPRPLPDVAALIAEVHAELVLIHPFREGNGRLGRWVSALMALQAGLPPPAYRFRGRGSRSERSRYMAAIRRGYLQDYEPLARFFADALARRLRGEE